MSSLYDDLMSGLQEAIEVEKGNLSARKTTYIIEPVKTYSNTDIRTIRINAGMTQAVFAAYMGVSKKTVEAWEKGTNNPTGSACRLLTILENNGIEELPFVKMA